MSQRACLTSQCFIYCRKFNLWLWHMLRSCDLLAIFLTRLLLLHFCKSELVVILELRYRSKEAIVWLNAVERESALSLQRGSASGHISRLWSKLILLWAIWLYSWKLLNGNLKLVHLNILHSHGSRSRLSRFCDWQGLWSHLYSDLTLLYILTVVNHVYRLCCRWCLRRGILLLLGLLWLDCLGFWSSLRGLVLYLGNRFDFLLLVFPRRCQLFLQLTLLLVSFPRAADRSWIWDFCCGLCLRHLISRTYFKYL